MPASACKTQLAAALLTHLQKVDLLKSLPDVHAWPLHSFRVLSAT